jgi:hypothetical protein
MRREYVLAWAKVRDDGEACGGGTHSNNMHLTAASRQLPNRPHHDDDSAGRIGVAAQKENLVDRIWGASG